MLVALTLAQRFARKLADAAASKERGVEFDSRQLPMVRKACGMAWAAYEEGKRHGDHEKLLKRLQEQFPDDAMLRLRWFQMQRGGHHLKPPWFLACGEDPLAEGVEAVFLSFRGSESWQDWLRDVVVVPQRHKGNTFHAGFLDACHDEHLKERLESILRNTPKARLYVVGHSLGGAVAHTFVAAGFVEEYCPHHQGQVVAINFGGPRVSSGQFNKHGSPHLEKSKFYTIINELDLVPRLLGAEVAAGAGAALKRWLSTIGKILERTRDFRDLPGLRLCLIQHERLLYVPEEHRRSVMSLDQCLGVIGEKLMAAIADHTKYPDHLAKVGTEREDSQKKTCRGKGGRGKGGKGNGGKGKGRGHYKAKHSKGKSGGGFRIKGKGKGHLVKVCAKK
mmetsp:Transcript_124688/g.364189  ORF Transcript_124688/g.364189 Transcript_124688/m.364189 type:complete len:392 (-) Transcript_124688:245-1420(-)